MLSGLIRKHASNLVLSISHYWTILSRFLLYRHFHDWFCGRLCSWPGFFCRFSSHGCFLLGHCKGWYRLDSCLNFRNQFGCRAKFRLVWNLRLQLWCFGFLLFQDGCFLQNALFDGVIGGSLERLCLHKFPIAPRIDRLGGRCSNRLLQLVPTVRSDWFQFERFRKLLMTLPRHGDERVLLIVDAEGVGNGHINENL